MKVLVVGQGSMGKRRVRCLKALGVSNVDVYDVREDRRLEARSLDTSVLEEMPTKGDYDLVMISVNPDRHLAVFEQTKDIAKNFFIEAGTCYLPQMKSTLTPYSKNIYPSFTSYYYNYSSFVRECSEKDDILMYSFHVGQNIADWHAWETVYEYYVSNPICNGNREIVPYELASLHKIFGKFEVMSASMFETGCHDFQMHDIYIFTIRHENGVVGQLTIEGFSRPEITRELRMFSATKKYEISDNDWSILSEDGLETGTLSAGEVVSGYQNPEAPYIHEVSDVIESIRTGDRIYKNTLDDELYAISKLYEIELKSGVDTYVKLDNS